MDVLFICTFNRWRSLTAEHLFNNLPGHQIMSAGTAATARVKVTAKLINWADLIFVMEKNHQEILVQKFPIEVAGKKIVCLNIPSGYRYMDEELVAMLKEGIKEYL